MVEYKNQHFVPQFYLKLFSGDAKTLLKYNLAECKSFQSKIETECAKNYFYGDTPVIEQHIALVERAAAKVIQKIITEQTIANVVEHDYFMLLSFILFQYARTSSAGKLNIELANKLFDEIKPLALRDEGIIKAGITKSDLDNLQLQNKHPTNGMAFYALLSGILIRDLTPLLLINSGPNKFVTSDHPVVLINSFFDGRVRGGTVGFASKGLQIVYPITPELMLILYDSDYYVATKKIRLKISNKDVRRLNGLQVLNCDSNLYYYSAQDARHVLEIIRNWVEYRATERAELETIAHGMNSEIVRSNKKQINYKLRLSFLSNKPTAELVSGVRDSELVLAQRKLADDLLAGKSVF